MMKSLFLLTGLIAIMLTSCRGQKELNLKCLSSTGNEYLKQLYSVFEEKLKDRYGELKSHELIYEYVNDFDSEKIDISFFKSFRIDTASGEFHRMFIRESRLPEEYVFDEEFTPIGDVQERKQSDNYFVVNPKSNYVSCLMQQKSGNSKVNNLLHDTFNLPDISPWLISTVMASDFRKNEYKDRLLQVYVMLYLFLLPHLYNQ